MSERIIALDVGTRMGYAISGSRSGHGVVDLSLRDGDSPNQKFVKLYRSIAALAKRATGGEGIVVHPLAIIAEGSAGFSRGMWAVKAANEYRGVIKLYCGMNNVPYWEVAPSSLKKFATGSGRAKKPEMIQAARRITGAAVVTDDEADALLLLEAAKAYLPIWRVKGKVSIPKPWAPA